MYPEIPVGEQEYPAKIPSRVCGLLLSKRGFLNLRDYRELNVGEDEHDYHVYVETTSLLRVCQHCGSIKVTKWGNVEIVVRDLPAQGKRVNLYIQAQRLKCQDCGRTASEPLPALADGRRMTRRLVAWVGEQSLKRVFASIADDTGLDERTVRSVFNDYVHELETTTKFETPRWLGLDEIHILKRARCVLTNVEQRTIVDMLPDRSKVAVSQRLFRFADKDEIRYVAMDMWKPYRDAVRGVLPKATIVIDKFHVVRMANEGVETVRKALREAMPLKERRGLMHDRYILLRRERDLDARERFLLDSWTKLHPVLGVAYRLKEDFYGIYDARTRMEAEARHTVWVSGITPEVSDAFKALTSAWKNWHSEILNYFEHFRVTNAYTESLNALIRQRSRAGRGYSFDALRAKMLYTEGLHKIERPKFERRAMSEFSAFMIQGDMRGVMTPAEVYGDPINYGTDLPTLARRLENGSF